LNTEDSVSIAKLWAASTLLQVGLRAKDPVIRKVLNDTTAFVQKHEGRKAAFEGALQQGSKSIDHLVDESTTGLLGVAIYLWYQLGKRELVRSWTSFFLESLAWNLSKEKTPSFRTNANLLLAASTGLTSIPKDQQTEALRSNILSHLQQICKAATTLELLKVTQAFEFLDAVDRVPKEPIRLVCSEQIQNGPIEDSLLGLILLEKLGDALEDDPVKHDIALLGSLQQMVWTASLSESQVWLRCFLIPWLHKRTSKQNLLDAWEQHKGQSYRLAKTLNYILVYVLLILVVTWAAYQIGWSWLVQQTQTRVISVLLAYFTFWFDVLLFVIEQIAQLHHKEFSSRNSVKLGIGIINGIALLIAAVFR
jgi:hypothetical protein